VTRLQIRDAAGAVEFFKPSGELQKTPKSALPSPGVGLRHYAPKARLVLLDTPLDRLGGLLYETTHELQGEKIGVMLPAGVARPARAAAIFDWGCWAAPEELAHALYAGLRTLDEAGCSVILCPVPPAEGIGAAIRDRLLKAGTRD
jgi:L-threonylcarbamoyladenylate synthase